MKRLVFVAILVMGCSDDDSKKQVNSDTNSDNSVNSTADMAIADMVQDADDEADAALCSGGQAFDVPLDTCIDCPSHVFICDSIPPRTAFDRASSVFSFTPEDGEASIVTATLGLRVFTNGGLDSEEFQVTGVLEGRTMTFDVGEYETSDSIQLYNLVFSDSCGTSNDLVFVANYDPGSTDPVTAICPLGG